MLELTKPFLKLETFEQAFQPMIPLKLIQFDGGLHHICMEGKYALEDFWDQRMRVEDYFQDLYRLTSQDSMRIGELCSRIATRASQIGNDIIYTIFYQVFAISYMNKYNGYGSVTLEDEKRYPVPILMRVSSPVRKDSRRINIVFEVVDLSGEAYQYGEENGSDIAIYSIPIEYGSNGFHCIDYSQTAKLSDWLGDSIYDKMRRQIMLSHGLYI